MSRPEGFLKVRANAPFWYFVCSIVLPLVLAAVGVYLFFESGLYASISEKYILSMPSMTDEIKAIGKYDSIWDVPVESIIILFGIVACSFCFLVSAFVLAFSLPIYLNSESQEKSNRAGGLVKTCLYFITGSASGILLAIGLA